MKMLTRLRIEIKNDLALNSAPTTVTAPAVIAGKSDGDKMDVDADAKSDTLDPDQNSNGNGVGSKIKIIYANENNAKMETEAPPTQNIIEDIDESSLEKLYESVGIKSNSYQLYRLDAIHLRGTDDLSTDHIFEYFEDFEPLHIEWISDDSCNVVWKDKEMAAKAMLSISKPINGMPVIGTCDPFVRTIVSDEDKVFFDNGIEISDITTAIPPGYWRLGADHPIAKCLLMRFAKKSDKKTVGAEKFSDYYKKHGNPNFNNISGYISQSKKLLLRKNRIKQILLENKRDFEMQKPQTETKTKSVHSSLTRVQRESSSSDDDGSEDDHKFEIKKHDRFFRMKMYADEEEDRLKGKSVTTSQKGNPKDLRNRINRLNTGKVSKSKSNVWSRIDRQKLLSKMN